MHCLLDERLPYRFCFLTYWIFGTILLNSVCGQVLTDAEFRNVSCDSFNFTATLSFPEVFKGIVYPEGLFDPKCMISAPDDGIDDLVFSLPVVECGNNFRQKDGEIWISNRFVIQKHPLVLTASDIVLEASCKISPDILAHKDFIHEHHPLPFISDEIEAYMDFQVGDYVLGSDVSNKLLVGDIFTVVIHVNNSGKYEDFEVVRCWAFDGETAETSENALEIYDSYNCDGNFLSSFNLSRTEVNASNVALYGHIKAFKFSASKNIHLKCNVQACVEGCIRGCYSSNGISNSKPRLVKRSMDEVPSISDRNLRQQHKFMKATIDALKTELMKRNARETMSENDTNFLKRSSSRSSKPKRQLFPNSHKFLFGQVYLFNVTNNVLVFTGKEFNSNHHYTQSPVSGSSGIITKIRFGIITSALSFVIFCLLLICIGFALHIHKVKKQQKIDSFLLYNMF